jgi:uncharacterized protein involved in type VI secretion and phage assembly
VSSFSAESNISSLYVYRIEFTSPDSDIGMEQVARVRRA